MHYYYLIYYKNLVLPDEQNDKPIRIYLEQLEKYGFPTEDFINFKTKEECDKKLSYAIRVIENNKYVVKVYYKCGEKQNYR